MSNAETEYVEVFNATGQQLQILEFREESGADSSDVNVEIGSGEYWMLCEDGINFILGVSCDANASTTLADAGEGFQIVSEVIDGGTTTDAVGDDAAGSDFQEGGGISVSGDMHVIRDTDVDEHPIDSDSNASDFRELVDLAELNSPKTGYTARTANTSSSIVNPSEVIVYPNPFVPQDGRNETGQYGTGVGEGIRFATKEGGGFPAGTELVIYTVTGERVTEIRTQTAGVIQWNARVNGGVRATSGVYLFRIHTPDGEEKVGKLSVVR